MNTRKALIILALVAIAVPVRAEYQPPANCVAWFDGCNTCVRVETEGGACTRKACVDETQAGYCTKYAPEEGSPRKEPAPMREEQEVQSPDPSVAENSPVEPTENTSSTGMFGLFLRIWEIFRSWIIF